MFSRIPLLSLCALLLLCSSLPALADGHGPYEYSENDRIRTAKLRELSGFLNYAQQLGLDVFFLHGPGQTYVDIPGSVAVRKQCYSPTGESGVTLAVDSLRINKSFPAGESGVLVVGSLRGSIPYKDKHMSVDGHTFAARMKSSDTGSLCVNTSLAFVPLLDLKPLYATHLFRARVSQAWIIPLNQLRELSREQSDHLWELFNHLRLHP